MNNIDDISQQSIPVGDAIREIKERLKNARLNTSQKIALSALERWQLSEAAREQAEREKDKLLIENTHLKNVKSLVKRNIISALKFLNDER